MKTKTHALLIALHWYNLFERKIAQIYININLCDVIAHQEKWKARMIYSKKKKQKKTQPPGPIDVMYVVHLDFWRTRTEKRDWHGQSSVPTMLDKTLVMVQLIDQTVPWNQDILKGKAFISTTE